MPPFCRGRPPARAARAGHWAAAVVRRHPAPAGRLCTNLSPWRWVVHEAARGAGPWPGWCCAPGRSSSAGRPGRPRRGGRGPPHRQAPRAAVERPRRLPGGGVFPSATPRTASRRSTTCAAQLRRDRVDWLATPDGNGLWLAGADGGVYTSGTPASTARWATSPCRGRSWAWRPPPTGAGYWLVAARRRHLRLRRRRLLRLDGRHRT